MLLLIKENKEIIAALIAFAGVLWTANVALRNNNRNILIKTVTEERAKWRNELRLVCAEFSKLVYEQISDSSLNHRPRINELKTHIKLRVNPSQKSKHLLDQNIIGLSQSIVDELDKKVNTDRVKRELLSLEAEIQQLLKNEWDKSKGEAVKGKVAK